MLHKVIQHRTYSLFVQRYCQVKRLLEYSLLKYFKYSIHDGWLEVYEGSSDTFCWFQYISLLYQPLL